MKKGSDNMANLGSWELDEIKSVNLPQRAASAFIAVTGDLVGADYMPVLYVGKQLVNGTNYCILAVQKLVVPNSPKHLVKMIIHEDLDGNATLSSVKTLAI